MCHSLEIGCCKNLAKSKNEKRRKKFIRAKTPFNITMFDWQFINYLCTKQSHAIQRSASWKNIGNNSYRVGASFRMGGIRNDHKDQLFHK
jgi:hypothetical protein